MKASLIVLAGLMQFYIGNPELPEQAKTTLKVHLPGWRILKYTGVKDSVDIEQVYGFSNIYRCDLNGDTIPDYGVAVTVGDGECLTEYFVALIGKPNGYAFYLLSSQPASRGLAGRVVLRIERKGNPIWDFSNYDETEGEPSPRVFEVDVLVHSPSDGCCETGFVFEDGHFRSFTASD
jgi:hypothetical protein